MLKVAVHNLEMFSFCFVHFVSTFVGVGSC
jgi:hypothetical protein